MLVSEFQEILNKINRKFIKKIDIINNYVDLYNENTKKAVKVSICNSKDLFREAIFAGICQINDKIVIGKDTKDILKVFSEHWNVDKTIFSIKGGNYDYFIEFRNFEPNWLIGCYLITETEAQKITTHFEGIKNPTLKQLLESIN